MTAEGVCRGLRDVYLRSRCSGVASGSHSALTSRPQCHRVKTLPVSGSTTRWNRKRRAVCRCPGPVFNELSFWPTSAFAARRGGIFPLRVHSPRPRWLRRIFGLRHVSVNVTVAQRHYAAQGDLVYAHRHCAPRRAPQTLAGTGDGKRISRKRHGNHGGRRAAAWGTQMLDGENSWHGAFAWRHRRAIRQACLSSSRQF